MKRRESISKKKMSLINGMAGIFPLCSYLHVPGKMSAPVWMMLGTCILWAPPNVRRSDRSRGLSFLTCAHTFLPWNFVKVEKPEDVTIPVEFRKQRFVIGKLFLFNEYGQAQKQHAFSLQLVAVNEELDVALLTMPLTEADAFRGAARSRQLDKFHTLHDGDVPVGSSLSLVGFRGVGRLGEVESTDLRAIKAMTAIEREELTLLFANAEGRQEASTAGAVCLRRGVGLLQNSMRAYQGQSGSPLCDGSGGLRGMLYGRPRGADEVVAEYHLERVIGYVPSTSILKWAEELFPS